MSSQMKLDKRIMNYWSKQLEYTRDDKYPNSCSGYSVTVHAPDAPVTPRTPCYEIDNNGAVVRSSIVIRGITRDFVG